jgi:hypothetical protein
MSSKKSTDLYVFSTPKSGSQYLALLLNNARYAVGHECVRKHGGVNPPEWIAFEPRQVFHLVRHPLHAIRSLTSVGLRWLQQWPTTKGLTAGSIQTPVGAGWYWLQHNLWIDSTWAPSLTFQIEKVHEKETWNAILDALEIEKRVPPIAPSNFGHQSKNYRHCPEPLRWEDLGEAEPWVRNLAEYYGYSTS